MMEKKTRLPAVIQFLLPTVCFIEHSWNHPLAVTTVEYIMRVNAAVPIQLQPAPPIV